MFLVVGCDEDGEVLRKYKWDNSLTETGFFRQILISGSFQNLQMLTDGN